MVNLTSTAERQFYNKDSNSMHSPVIDYARDMILRHQYYNLSVDYNQRGYILGYHLADARQC
jgi:hypothetical protein